LLDGSYDVAKIVRLPREIIILRNPLTCARLKPLSRLGPAVLGTLSPSGRGTHAARTAQDLASPMRNRPAAAQPGGFSLQRKSYSSTERQAWARSSPTGKGKFN
jgi:hypothetical protein